MSPYSRWARASGCKHYVYAHATKRGVFYVGVGNYSRPHNFFSRNDRWKEVERESRRLGQTISILYLSRHRSRKAAELSEARYIEFYDPPCNLERKQLHWIKQKYEWTSLIRRKRKARTA